MHVLVIPSEHFVTLRYPLGGIFQRDQANSLQRAGFQVGVIAPGIISPRFLIRCYPYPRSERSNGYPVLRHYVRKFYPHRWLRPTQAVPLYQRLGMALYRSYTERFGVPDLVHAHNVVFAGFIAQAIRNAFDVPYVITEHSSNFMTSGVAPEWKAPVRSCVQDAAAMTAVSRALAQAIKRDVSVEDIDILPNIVDATFLDSPLVVTPSREPGIVFLSIGSLNANKNHASLIEAFAQYFRGKQVSLRIAGRGPLELRLRRLAGRLRVEGQVAFLGHLDRTTILRELQSADCLVLSSLRETFGVVLIEALACGRPVIATRCGGPMDIVNATNGVLVDPGDTVALGAAMERMAQTRGVYRPEGLREECRVRFGETAFVEKVQHLYSKALNEH